MTNVYVTYIMFPYLYSVSIDTTVQGLPARVLIEYFDDIYSLTSDGLATLLKKESITNYKIIMCEQTKEHLFNYQLKECLK